MRDLLDLIQTLSEGTNLAPNEFNNRPKRFSAFIDKIINKQNFTTVDNQQVQIDPSEAERFKSIWDPKTIKFIDPSAKSAKLAQGFTYAGKDEIPLGKLKKTTEFGGASVAVGGSAASGGKASYALTPQAIGIVDKDIPAAELYDMIANNTVLQSTSHGQVVINLANYIVSGESVSIPPEVAKNKQLLAAIQDNAGEYLGVLALVYYRTRFPARANFEQWLGGKSDDLVLRFPSAANFALADSFASVKNPETNHSVNISSKGKGGGAAPAISGLKIPKHIAEDPKLVNAVAFVKLCQEKGTIDQAFDGIDLLFKNNPDSISEVWHQFLPFKAKPKIKQAIIDSLKGQDVKFSKAWSPIINGVKSKEASNGGKILYAIKKEVAEAVNNRDALPEFRDMVLEILEMNFIQQYMDYEKKNKYEFTFETQWPAKLDGQVTLENKSSAKEPTTGGFSFKLGRTDSNVSDEPDEVRVDNIEDEEDFVDMSAQITGTASGKSSKSKASAKPTVGDVGRKKR